MKGLMYPLTPDMTSFHAKVIICYIATGVPRGFNPALIPPFLFMVALWKRADHYIFILWFLLSFSFFPRLISAVGDWMSAILPQFSANVRCGQNGWMH